MRSIQSKILPQNWLHIIDKFDVKNSALSENKKIIATYIIENIKTEKEKCLINPLSKYLVRHIVFGEDFLTSCYDNLPSVLVEDGFSEITGEKGLNLTRKLHSLFVEFLTYKDLIDKGYKITDFIREESSCDLKLIKKNTIYNFEVKYKESEDTRSSRFYDYIDGYSLLLENKFLRGETFKINLNISDLDYSTIKKVLAEIDIFLNQKNDIFNGEYIQVFNREKSHLVNRDINEASQYLNNFIIEKINNIDRLIETMFIENNGHITKLINKSKRFQKQDNFVGCLVWSIPFYNDINSIEIEKSFIKVLDLDFDLFVYTGGVGRDEYNFIVKKNNFLNNLQKLFINFLNMFIKKNA